jgi:sarcosine oxidase, subunit beta
MNRIAETDVCVIGAGVMGASAAYHLAVRGRAVLVVEKSAPGSEASGATAGTLAIQNKHLGALPLVIPAIRMWEGLSKELGADVGYEKRGGYRVAQSAAEIEKIEAGVLAQRARGAPVEMIYQPQLRAQAPFLSEAIEAAAFCPDDGMASPFLTVRAFLVAGARHGVTVWNGCEVIGIDVRGDDAFVVRTTSGEIRCAHVLAAAGAWNAHVAAMVGVTLPLHAEVLQVLITDPGPPIFPAIVTHARGNLTLKQQRPSGKVLIGGGWHGDGDPRLGVKRVRRENMLGNLRCAIEAIPGIGRRRVLRAWVGFEGRTPDRLLISGPVGAPRGFHVVGCAAGGFTVGPLAGRIAAEYIVDGRPAISCDAFHVQRFVPAVSGQASS